MYSEEEFKQRFHFKKQTVHLFTVPNIIRFGVCLAKQQQLHSTNFTFAVALPFYATGHFQITDGDLMAFRSLQFAE